MAIGSPAPQQVGSPLQSPGATELSVDLGGSTLRSPGTLTTTRRRAQTGRPARRAGHRSTVSIPSKFAAVVSAPETEPDAFGSRTTRRRDYRSDRPGPGQYRPPQTMGRKAPAP